MFAAVKNFNMTVWLIITGAFASRFVLFMIWPYLAVLLHENFNLDPFSIGLFLSAAGIGGTLFGFYAGYLSDQIGRRKIILAGTLISALSALSLGYAQDLVWFFIATFAASLARGMTEGPGRALMTDMVESRQDREMALQVRYFALNVGAALGPMTGAYAGLSGHQSTFSLLAGIYALYLITAAYVFRVQQPANRTEAKKFSFLSALRVLRADRRFLSFVLAAFLGNIAYAQIETGMVQYLQLNNFPGLVALYAQIMMLNGITIMIFQFPLLALLKGWSPFARAQLGVTLFAAGFAGFAIAPLDTSTWLLVSVFVLSMGEVILFPTINIIVDRIAPSHMKGSYFGAAGLAGFGFAFAPLVGGALLSVAGGLGLWSAMAGLSLAVGLLYLGARRRGPLPA